MAKSEKRQRTKLIAVRFTPEEYRKLALQANVDSVSISELIRRGVGL